MPHVGREISASEVQHAEFAPCASMHSILMLNVYTHPKCILATSVLSERAPPNTLLQQPAPPVMDAKQFRDTTRVHIAYEASNARQAP
jgi:hypothetical protein